MAGRHLLAAVQHVQDAALAEGLGLYCDHPQRPGVRRTSIDACTTMVPAPTAPPPAGRTSILIHSALFQAGADGARNVLRIRAHLEARPIPDSGAGLV